ncbi:tRNA 2-thiouridine(34) synthase MnmA [Candidatus Uhrbacteria bacterium]|jgi:tRNA-uridine 2-sulfurtransferase|nr:tRNA 2-thiouridine(34) synthase MnmA [Candidatus Uhrbacteria bacterium]MBT7717290.1 tRNA 2-thiouridine(34) synthase MnmA [Candidatus Uhrbacteria bacterium]
MKKSKILVGMSGGVDSSVAALLLQKQGHHVIGGFMKNWSDEVCDYQATSPNPSLGRRGISECTWRTERRDAMRVAAKLGIEFHTYDFEKEYREQVYEYMLAEYKAGRTPNPDVLCNKYMKFGLFAAKAKELGCEYVATGHYARVTHSKSGSRLFAGKDQNKDQSYFLARLTQDQLKYTLFPIGRLRKAKVRKLAKKHDLHVAGKKDSQGICFVGQVALDDFLGKRIKAQEGNIVNTDSEILGQHKGHMFFTIGQRHGLNLGGVDPFFVVERRADSNELVVAHEGDPALYQSELVAINISETIEGRVSDFIGKKLKARIRYRQELQDCTITSIEKGKAHVEFALPQRAIAPGQFIAWYKGKELLGSGIIQ